MRLGGLVGVNYLLSVEKVEAGGKEEARRAGEAGRAGRDGGFGLVLRAWAGFTFLGCPCYTVFALL